MALKTIEIELFDNISEKYEPISAIIDTGANRCALSTNVADKFGIKMREDLSHYWQANCPLSGKSSEIRVRYSSEIYELKASCIEIDEKYLRPMMSEEECTRPESPHPLGYGIILGLNFINVLPTEERHNLIGFLFKI